MDEPSLRRIDTYVRNSLGENGDESAPTELDCLISTYDGATFRFKSIDMLLDHCSKTRDLIKNLDLNFRATDIGRINIYFQDAGVVRFTVSGSAQNTEFMAEGLTREIKNCGPSHNWLIRLLAFSRSPGEWLTILLVMISLFLLWEIPYYFYADRVGVDINPSLLHDGNLYYRDVEHAIQSSSIEEKLNVLLKGQLKNFTNVSAVLKSTQIRIGAGAAVLVGIVFLLFALRSYSSAYPRAYFSLGLATDHLHRLERKRDIWTIGVGLAFVVNLVAGIVVAFLS